MEDKEMTINLARSLLPESESIHVFLNPNGMLLGADWSRKEVLDLISSADELRFSGKQAEALKHGLAAFKDNKWHFIKSKEQTK